ncbi:glycoside hydrolase family 32 protein [Paenibacillus sp. D9]|uniref:glycoside hydrolase family 32 protein n=1 Tax=Paenibacillus TaxID=44249 RepID=UPI00061E83E7|nr:glycoside hydrolase family 32 protein [Paenibacillus sp. D9]KKC47205.1 glycoside hydrolase [Paenibacillus sp. D9]
MNPISNTAFRPEYHFTPPAGWMNDPNGMVYYRGAYHLFYQHHPRGTTWGPMHWGHAVSKDLIRWEHRPIALAPDEHGMIFSGSAVVDRYDTSGFFGGGEGLVAIFTHHDEHPVTGAARQRQSLAYSLDEGATWIKYAGNPVLSHESHADFRDPKVFRHEGCWIMILASGQTVTIYRSVNLIDWTFASEFGQGIGSHDGVWECPDLFPLAVDGDPQKRVWAMLVSIGNDPGIVEGSRIQYFMGSFDGFAFTPDEASNTVRWLDHGRDNYAAVTWSGIPETDGRTVCIGWMSNWRYANQTPTEGWRSAMTIPRELALDYSEGDAVLVQRPVRELESARQPLLSLLEPEWKEAQSKLSGFGLDSFEMVAEFEAEAGAGEYGISIRMSAEEETRVGFSPQSGELFVDRTRSGVGDFHVDFAGRHAMAAKADGGRMKLRILVDRSSVEVFACGGRAVMTELIFPDPESLGLLLFGSEDRVKLLSLELYRLALGS